MKSAAMVPSIRQHESTLLISQTYQAKSCAMSNQPIVTTSSNNVNNIKKGCCLSNRVPRGTSSAERAREGAKRFHVEHLQWEELERERSKVPRGTSLAGRARERAARFHVEHLQQEELERERSKVPRGTSSAGRAREGAKRFHVEHLQQKELERERSKVPRGTSLAGRARERKQKGSTWNIFSRKS